VDSDRSLHTPEDWALFMDAIDAAIRDKADFQTDTRLVFPSGAIRHLHIVGHPVISASGEVVELVGTSMDVSEQHNSRLALQSAFDEIKVLKDQLQRENVALRDEIDRTSMFEEVVGESSPLKTALSKVTRVAPTDATVLITGETGTGKELIARAVHKRSTRAGRAFVTLNCAALAPSLISSELFGHEKGAFTGATERRLGRFELADGGTIFLDEVGDLPSDTQTMLLRVLQEREFERVGGSRPIKTDVRVIAATNRDLHAGIREGIFRADLFYRLNVFPIDVPSLRDRPEDVPLLVKYFVDRYARKAGKRIRAVDRNSLEILQSYSWPGNIRELQNVIERSVIICDTETLSVDRSWFRSEPPRSNEADRGLADALDGQERSLIEAALTGTRGKVAGPFGAAAKLKVSSTTLESKIKSLGINKAHFKAAH
jgi:transcriptional regulator with GAF, ATPase, and Fis domain